MVGNQTPEMVVRQFLKTYERNCLQTGTIMSPSVKRSLKAAVEANTLLTSVIVALVPLRSCIFKINFLTEQNASKVD